MEGAALDLRDSDSDSLPFGDGVSGRGGERTGGVDDNDEENLFYVPERRPSLDLGEAGDGSPWW